MTIKNNKELVYTSRIMYFVNKYTIYKDRNNLHHRSNEDYYSYNASNSTIFGWFYVAKQVKRPVTTIEQENAISNLCWSSE